MTNSTPRAAGIMAPVALPQAISQWREQSVGWVRVSDAESAAVLAKRRGAAMVPRVVVVGETNRGKSSLVNALLGMPALSPVDSGLATCTYLQFTHGTSPTAVAHFGGGMADITFPTGELPVWAVMSSGTMNSEPDNDLPPPRWIEVAVPAPLLQTVTLVDTPGVGGLMAGHADLAAEAAAAATALLFVVDASAPFTKGELDFLQRIGNRVDSVHFVVAKTDIFRGWREILQADQQLLARYLPRFTDAPFYPVASTLATAADGQPNPQIADVVRTQSGIVELRRVLAEDVAARASLLADANLIRTTVTVLTGDIVGLENQRRALTSGAAQSEALRARREELLGQRKSGGRSWQVMLRAEIQRARVDLTHDTAREVREAAQLFRGAIDAADADALKQLPFHIDAYAQAMTARAHGRLLESMSRIVNLVLRELFNPEELAALAAAVATRPYAPLVTRGPDRTKSADETLMSMAGGGIGLSLGSLVRMAAAPLAATAFGVVLLPVSLVLGGTAAFFMVRSRRRVQDRQHLKSWLMEVLGEAKAQIDQNVAEQFIDADQQLTLALDDALSKQVAAVESEIRQVDGALKLDATERAARLRTIAERRASGATLLATGEALLDRIRRTRPVGSVRLPGSAATGAMTGRRTIALPPGFPPAPFNTPTASTPAAAPPLPAAPPPLPASQPAPAATQGADLAALGAEGQSVAEPKTQPTPVVQQQVPVINDALSVTPAGEPQYEQTIPPPPEHDEVVETPPPFGRHQPPPLPPLEPVAPNPPSNQRSRHQSSQLVPLVRPSPPAQLPSQPVPDNGIPGLITGVPRRSGRGAPLIPHPEAFGALMDRATGPVAASTISSADVPHPDIPKPTVAHPDVPPSAPAGRAAASTDDAVTASPAADDGQPAPPAVLPAAVPPMPFGRG